MAFVTQHLLPGIPDVNRMGVLHDLEPGAVRTSCLGLPDPLDQEVAEAAVSGQDRSVIAPVLAVVTAEAAGREAMSLVVRKVLPANLHVRIIVAFIGALERFYRSGDHLFILPGKGRIS